MGKAITLEELVSFTLTGDTDVVSTYGFRELKNVSPLPWEGQEGTRFFRRGVSSVPISRSGYTSSKQRWPFVEMTLRPICFDHLACVRFHLVEDEWVAYPDLVRIDERPVHYAVIEDDTWFVKLIERAGSVVEPFLELMPAKLRELRQHYDEENLASALGQQHNDMVEWILQYARWEVAKDARPFGGSYGASGKARELEKLENCLWRNSATNPDPHRVKIFVEATSKSAAESHSGGIVSMNEKRGQHASAYVSEEIEDWFGKSLFGPTYVGGPPELVFATGEIPDIRKLVSERTIEKSGLWWWRGMDAWPQALRDLFDDSWKRSAFYYEFRARRRQTIEWRPFRVPWAWLNSRQRALLYFLWPPVTGRRYSFYPLTRPNILGAQREARKVTINLCRPWNDVVDELKSKWTQLSIELGQMGISGAPAHTQDEAGIDWQLLEEMDRKFLLNATMPNKYLVQKRRRQSYYDEACLLARIAP